MGPHSFWRTLVYTRGRVRAPWRILLFVLFFAVLQRGLAAAFARIEWTGLLPQGVAMLGAALIAGWLLIAALDARPIGALGFARTERLGREIGGGFGTGLGGLLIAVVATAATGALRYGADGGDWSGWVQAQLFWFIVLAFPAAAEEAIFRGYPFQVLVQGIGAMPAALVASGLFAFAHWWNPNVTAIALVNIFLAGVMLSVAYLRTRSLWFASALHLGWNWSMAALFDLPVSGLGFIDTPLYEPRVGGPEWWSGSSFGPEGGLVATLGFFAMMLLLWLPGVREAEAMRRLRPLVDTDEHERLEPATTPE